MKYVLRKLIRQRGPRNLSGALEMSLLNMYWVCEGLRALSFDEDTAIGEWWQRELSLSTDTSTMPLIPLYLCMERPE